MSISEQIGKEKIQSTYDPGSDVHGDGWLTLHRNENMFVGRDWTVDTARKLVADVDISTYPGATCDDLRAALAEAYGVKPENIFVGNGSDEVLADLLDLLRHSYETMHVLDACFKIYLLLAERYHYNVKTLAGDTFQTGHVKGTDPKGLAVIDSPNAITSATVSQDDLSDLARDSDAFVIWDNAYGEYAGDEVPTAMPDNMVVVRSFSKYYALAGLRIGYCIADEALVKELLARKDAFNVNAFAQIMALEALNRRERFEQLKVETLECRDALVAHLRGYGFDVHPSGGNFVLASHPKFSGSCLQDALMQRQVAVRRFPGELTGNHIRITVPPMPIVQKFAGILGQVLDATPSRSSTRNGKAVPSPAG